MSRRESALEWLSRTMLRIGTDATWVFIIVVALSLCSSAFSIRYLSSLESELGDLYENDLKGQTYAQNASITLVEMESSVKDLVIADNEQVRSASVAALARDCSSLQSLVPRMTLTLNAARYRALIAKSKRDMEALVDAVHNALGVDPPTQSRGVSLLAELETVAAPLKSDIATVNDIKRTANRNWLRAVRIQLRISLAIAIGILLMSVTVRGLLYRASKRALRTAAAAPGKGDRGRARGKTEKTGRKN